MSNGKVEAMRRAFDQAFAAPDQTALVDVDDFLAIRVGARPFALRVAELARVEVGRRIVPLPGGHAWLIGLAGSQGKLLPTFSLELALGFERTSDGSDWIAVALGAESLGLAFDKLEGYLRVPRTEIFSTGAAPTELGGDRAVRGLGELRPIVHVPSLAAAIRARL